METHFMRKIYLMKGNSSVPQSLCISSSEKSKVTGLSFNIHIFIEYNLLGNRRLDDLPMPALLFCNPGPHRGYHGASNKSRSPCLCVTCVCASGRRPLPPYARFRVTLVSGGGR